MYEFDGEDFTGQKASATSPLHLPYISPTSPLYLGEVEVPRGPRVATRAGRPAAHLGRYGGDMGEIWGRCGGDVGEM